VRRLEILHGREEPLVVCPIQRRLAARERNQLALVHEVDVAPQRRARPGVARHAQALMRCGHRAHPDLAALLHAVDRRRTARRELAPPRAVHVNHELRDDPVHRRAAQPAHDAHAVVLDIEAVLGPRLELGLGAAPRRFQRAREAPQVRQRVRVGVIDASRSERLLVERLLQRGVPQVVRHRHALDPRRLRHDRIIGRNLDVARERRAIPAFSE
jgi:hypothetical protein